MEPTSTHTPQTDAERLEAILTSLGRIASRLDAQQAQLDRIEAQVAPVAEVFGQLSSAFGDLGDLAALLPASMLGGART